MANVTFICEDGKEVVAHDAVGNLMEVALENDVEGILGACGGCCSCGTCHIRVHSDWLKKTGLANEIEQDLFDVEEGTDERSRLSCQVEMNESLDGIVVEVAPF